ncbi:MAG: DnaB family ATPase, partial [Anaeroplasmataceae bacterium]
MSEEQVFQRMISRYAEFPYEKIAKKELTKEDIDYLKVKATEFREKFKGQFEIYQNRSGICVKHMEAHIARRQRAGLHVHDIFVDYLQILVEPTGKGNKTEVMEELCRQCRHLSQKMKIRVFMPAQLNSAAKDKPIEDVHDGDINWAKNLARECDVLLVLHKHKEYGLHQIKYILARINHTDDTYYLPDADLGIMKFGKAVLWDEQEAANVAEARGLIKNNPKKVSQKKINDAIESNDWY